MTKKENVETNEKSACACKCACKNKIWKWFPHVFINLKVLYVLSVIAFYAILLWALYGICQEWFLVIKDGQFGMYWKALLNNSLFKLIGGLINALPFVLVAQIICALKKIKCAVSK